ncbi:hypothetical protein HID58_050786 [Brassica napus]|uniref:Uncharacterized protein n=1 Tax=Brassica napus TaxID=3708 RepID=A0ABQ8A732_BRANA|nr:hypothetical protein HID58_050786 [Brassica napus]
MCLWNVIQKQLTSLFLPHERLSQSTCFDYFFSNFFFLINTALNIDVRMKQYYHKKVGLLSVSEIVP